MRLVEQESLDAGITTGDLDNVFIDLPELFMGTVIVIDRGAERVTKLLHVFFKLTDVLPELADPDLNVLRLFFDLQATQALQDCLKVGHEARRADDDNFFIAKSVLDQVAGARSRADVANQQIVIQRLTGDKHKCEVHRVLARSNIFARLVNPAFEVHPDLGQQLLALGLAVFADHAVVIFEAKFAVD